MKGICFSGRESRPGHEQITGIGDVLNSSAATASVYSAISRSFVFAAA